MSKMWESYEKNMNFWYDICGSSQQSVTSDSERDSSTGSWMGTPEAPEETTAWTDDRDPSKLKQVDPSLDFGMEKGSDELMILREGEELLERNDDDLALCEKHGKEIRFLCSECQAPGCVDCVTANGGSCTFKTMLKYKRKLCRSIVKGDLGNMENLRSTIMSAKSKFESKINDIKQCIEQLTVDVLLHVEKKREALLSQLEKVLESKNSSWENQIEICDRALFEFRKFSKTTKNPTFREANNLRRCISGIVGTSLDYIEEGRIDFIKDYVLTCNLGEIRGSENPKNSYIALPFKSHANKFNMCDVFIRDDVCEPVFDSEYSVHATLHDADEKSVFLIIENVWNGHFRIGYYPLSPGTYTFNVFLNRCPIGGSPCRIEVLENEQPVLFKQLKMEESDFSRPWGVCCDDVNRILVVDRGNHCVRVFADDGRFLAAFGREGTGRGEFIRPAGIAADKLLKRIIVVDKDNHRVQVFTYEGSYLFHFGQEGTANGQFSYPWDVAVNGSSQLAVSDSKNRRIQLFSGNGGFLRTFSFQASIANEIELPRGLAFTSNGSLLATDFNKHKILILRHDFEVVRVFGIEGSDVFQFNRPQGIDISEDGIIAVVDGKNNRIQIFEADGKFLGIIGDKGPQKLDSPQGICFLPDGRLVVTELTNNRVQILEFDCGIVKCKLLKKLNQIHSGGGY